MTDAGPVAFGSALSSAQPHCLFGHLYFHNFRGNYGCFVSKSEEVEHIQGEELEIGPQQPHAYVAGREMPVPQT